MRENPGFLSTVCDLQGSGSAQCAFPQLSSYSLCSHFIKEETEGLAGEETLLSFGYEVADAEFPGPWAKSLISSAFQLRAVVRLSSLRVLAQEQSWF